MLRSSRLRATECLDGFRTINVMVVAFRKTTACKVSKAFHVISDRQTDRQRERIGYIIKSILR